MKLTMILLLVGMLQVSASVYSQNGKISVEANEMEISELLWQLQESSGIVFVYKTKDLQGVGKVTVSKEDAALTEILDEVLEGTHLEYKLKGDVVTIKSKPIVEQEQKKSIIIKGKISDESGTPIPGVTVMIEGTYNGTATNTNGIFSLKSPTKNGVLNVSFVGFATQKINYDGSKPLTIILKQSVSDLDEVTIVAYGTQSTREVTGAISSLKSAEIKDVPSASISNLLQGKVAGMSVTNSTGSPGGGGTSIVIRGFNSLSVESDRRASEPLWVVDGVPIQSFTSPITGTNTLSDIDPNDIESIEILKDAASASLYGSRAANGVILVTTKKGAINKAKLSINYARSFGFKPTMSEVTGGVEERRFRFNQLLGLRTAYRTKSEDGYYVYKNPNSHIDAYNNSAQYDLWWNQGKGYNNVAVQDSLNPFYNNSTDWFDLYMQSAKTTNVNLNVNGGTEKIRYNIGLGYYDEKGVVTGTDFNRINLLSNFQIKPMEKMDMDFRFYLARTDRGRSAQSGYSGIELMKLDPFRMSTTLPGLNSGVFNDAMNNVNGVVDDNIGYRLRSSFNVGYQLLKGLKFNSTIALDYIQSERNYFAPSTLNFQDESQVTNMVQKGSMVLNENLLTYQFNINKNKFDVMLGSSFQWDSEINLNGTARGGASDHIKWAVNFPQIGIDENDQARAMQGFMSDKEEKTLIGLFGRLNYVFNKKYLASFTFRRDGSSTFGEDNRWGTFPSGSVGWIMSEEPFVKSIEAIDFLKLRASYGKTGLHFSQPYLAYGVFEPSASSFLGRSAIEPNWDNGLYNPKLGWEETGQLDFGIDIKLLKNKFELSLDYYNRQTDRMLAEVVLPSVGSYTGYKQQWQNAYSISNEGVELMLKANILNKKDLFWDVTFNIARNWNRFEGGADGRDFKSGSSNISIQGKPLNQLYVYKQDGFYQTDEEVPVYDYIKQKYYYSQYGSSKYFRYGAGDPKYLDVNGDGTINSDDKVASGSPLPMAVGGIVNTIKWKNFDLNCLFNFQLSRKILNAAVGEGLSVDVNPFDASAHTSHPILLNLNDYSFWQQPGDNADLARIQVDPGKKVYSNFTDDMIENVSFIKLKSIALGYTLKNIVKNSDMSARFFVSGENLFTVTNYSGRDPEAVDVVYGIDYAQTYPLVKKVTIGASLNF